MKTEDLRVKEITAQPVATIRKEVPTASISQALGEMLPEVWGALAGRGIQPAGQPLAIYHQMSDNITEIEAGMPVPTKVDVGGRIVCRELPGGRIAEAIHYGPYDELGTSVNRLKEWMAEQSVEAAGPHWEVYETDPGKEPDPQKWRTRLCWPIR